MSTEQIATPPGGALGGALGNEMSFLLARANALSLAAGNAALAASGLRARSYSILALSVDGSRPSQRDLADFLRLDPSQVVALVDDLQARGLVVREPDPADRRANVVVATPTGRLVYEQAHAAARAAEEQVFGRLTPVERDRLAALLRLVAFPD